MALKNASKYRKKYGQVMWGESIFSKIILDNISMNIDKPKKTIIKSGNDNIYIEEMHEIQKYKNNLESVPFTEFYLVLNRLYSERNFLIVNRFGQSFLIIPDYNSKTMKIFDSHQKCIGNFDSQGAIKYILLIDNNPSTIIWIKGYMDNDNINSNVLKILYTPTNIHYSKS